MLPEKTTCLFCSNLVLLQEKFETTRENKNGKRSELLRNLCSHAKISNAGISTECRQSMFPFCGICEELLMQLWNYQEMLDKLKLKIAKVVTTIETLVVDGEILKPRGNSRTDLTEPKFVLRNAILEGYRKKLLLKQELQNRAILSEIASSGVVKTEHPTNLSSENHFNIQLSPNPTESSEECEAIIENEVDVNEEVVNAPDVSTQQVLQEHSSLPLINLEANDAFLQPNNDTNDSCTDESSNQAEDIDDASWTIDSDVIAQYNSDDSPLLVPSIEETSQGNNTDEHPVLLNIKQEIVNSQPTYVNENDGLLPENLLNDDDDDIFVLDPRKRRVIFDGVEIYKCTTSCPNEEILQCSLCYHTIKISKRLLKGEMSSFTKMKLHIYTVHKDATIPRQYTCTICSKAFSKRQHLRDHKKTHPPSQRQYAFECDICFRPIRSSSYVNLLSHKFSHKNDEERKAAIAAGEKGTCKALLATRRIKKPRSKKDAEKNKDGSKVLPINCPVCNRSFARQGHLGRHLKVHTNLEIDQYKGGSELQFQSDFPSVSFYTGLQPECFINTEQPTTVEVLCDPVEILSTQKDQIPMDDGDTEYLAALLLKIETGDN